MTDPYAMGPPRGFHPPQARDLVSPEIRASIYADGMARARAVAAAEGITWARTAERTHGPTGQCKTHPDQPGGRTGAGDAFCGQCRRAESRTGLREAVAEEIPHDENEPPREDER